MNFQKISQYVFFAFLFLLPFQTVFLLREPEIFGEKWQYGTIGAYGTDLLLFLAIFFAVIASESEALPAGRQESRGGHFGKRSSGLPQSLCSFAMTEWSFILFLLWSGFSIFWAADQVLSGYFFAKLLLAAGVFSLARSFDDTGMKTAAKVLVAAAVIQSVLGAWQFLSQETFSSTLLGMSSHEAWQAGTSVLKNMDGRFLRAYGSLPHPNILGGFLAVTLLLSISYLVSGIKIFSVIASESEALPAGRRESMEENFSQRLSGLPRARRLALAMTVQWAGLLIILLALILTFSRAAWLGAALGIGMIVFFQKSRTINHKSRIIFWVLVVAAVVFVFALRDQVFPRFDLGAIEYERSVSERAQSLADAKELIVAHPFVGVGAGNSTGAVATLHPDRPVWSIQPAHNVFVLVLAELGLVGLLLFAFFIVSVIASVARRSRNRKNLDCRGSEALPRNDKEERPAYGYRNAVFAAVLLVLLPSLLLDHFLWSSHFGLLFFFLLAGFAVRKG